MSMILAPYNDAMRIGQGFNSYTHEICLDGAVLVDANHDEKSQTRTIERPSQVVSYSARAVDKLSDVIQTMNISYPHSIKKGNVTISGSNTAIDEATFKSADINIIVTVKVTNQTTLIKSNARFVPMKGLEPGSQTFHDSYGDSYISGFIEGGEFTGIISIKVLNRSNVDLTVNKIKARLDAKDNSTGAAEFTLNSNSAFSSNGSASVMGKTESHIHVSWMGGGEIKDENTAWDIDSIFKAAAAFPQRVSERPQRTWAILTKYKSNRSFMDWASNKPIKTLEYDQVNTFTAELFDNYMEYKILLKYVQLIIDHPESYEAVEGKDSLDTSTETLLGVRLAMRLEQSKIVEATSALSRDPGILERQKWSDDRCTPSLTRFMRKAQGNRPSPVAEEGQRDLAHEATPPKKEFDFGSMIPAEFWKKWLPVPKSTSASLPPSDDLNWGNLSGAGTAEKGKGSDNAALLQEKIDALTKDLQQKTEEHASHANSLREAAEKLKSDNCTELETLRKNHREELESQVAEHTRNSTKLQDALDKLKSDNSTELEALKKKHEGEVEVMNNKLTAYEDLKAGQKSAVDQMLERLANDSTDKINAVTKQKQDEYDSLREKYDALEELNEQKNVEILRVEKDKKDAVEKLEKDNYTAYKALEDLYKPLKESFEKLTKDNATLAADKNNMTKENGSLTTQLQQKISDYNSLKALYDPLKKGNDDLVLNHAIVTKERDNLTTETNALKTTNSTLTTENNTLKTKNKDAIGLISKLKDKMKWADLDVDSLMENSLPHDYSGFIVMIFMPYSRLALDASKDRGMAQGWNFDMTDHAQIFKLNKANKLADTPWTITHLQSGKRLCFINGGTAWQVRVREKDDYQIKGTRGDEWYIGRGSPGSATWVFKNVQWGTCIQLAHGGYDNGRQAESFECSNAGDANWVIIPLGIRYPDRY